MWDRGILKSNAKLALKGRYWLAFAASLIVILGGSLYSIVTAPFQVTPPPADLAATVAQAGTSCLISMGSILFGIFVTDPFVIGSDRFYVQNRFGVTEVGTVFSGFRRNYGNGVGAMFVTQLFVFLWSLLLIIPGIVKSLQYVLVPYLLSDNPDLPGSRAREISRMMTDGEKGAIFVLGLSFLGWFLLGAVCLGVGIFFVIPYYEATMAELYIFLRDRAIQAGRLNPAELGLIAPAPYSPEP